MSDSEKPDPKFQKGDEVIHSAQQARGIVDEVGWNRASKSNMYLYTRHYWTNKMKGPDTVWVKVKPGEGAAPEDELEKAS